jgi:23S rRNA pseudouridine1911/1915/1917 synthase
MSIKNNQILKFVAPESSARLDEFLSAKISSYSKRFVKQLCKDGFVSVNGTKKPGGYILQEGDEIEVISKALAAARVVTGSVLDIIYEDEYLLVVNKPRAMHCITLRDEDPTTLADCIVSYEAKCIDASPDRREAGLIHRLDFYTSGLLLVAKGRDTWEKLRHALHNGHIIKTYLAIVEGRIKESKIKASFLLRQSNDSKRMVIDEKTDSQPQQTLVENIKYFSAHNVSLIRGKTKQAVRHQIRAHLSLLGHPLIGDSLYGSRHSLLDIDQLFMEKEFVFQGFFLHAESINFSHPVHSKKINVKKSVELATASGK